MNDGGEMMMDDLHREEIEKALRVMDAEAPSGDDLWYARKALGLSHAELAGALGVSEASVRAWEGPGDGAPSTARTTIVLLLGEALGALPATPPPDRDAPIRVVSTADAEEALCFLLTADPADLLGRSHQPSDGPHPLGEALRDVFRHRDHLAAQVTELQRRATAAIEARRLMIAALAGVVIGYENADPAVNPYAHPGDTTLREAWAQGHAIAVELARRGRVGAA